VSGDQETEELGTGYDLAEGPLWYKEGGYLLFSAIRSNRRMKWAPQEGVTLFREPTDNANGLTRDLQGRLIACESSSRRMSRLEADGSITVVADRYEGKRLNSPNDVVVKSDGSIYFTDPGMDTGLDLDFAGVYRVSADLSAVTLLVRDFVIPNGLVFSPDESILYINDSVGALDRRPDDMFHSIGHIRAFDVQADGTLANGRVFCEMRGERSGIPDGMKVDVEGNMYCTGPGGVWVIDPSGRHLGTILTGAPQTTNCAWGGDDWKTLFMTTMDSLSRIQLKIAGMPVPQ
jgi:gluconolactonase